MRATPRFRTLPLAGSLFALLLAPLPAEGQRDPTEWRERCERAEWQSRREVVCEVRVTTLPATGRLMVDAEPNGGIHVQGWDRDEIRVVALVSAYADAAAEARALATEVRVVTDGGVVRTAGPDSRGRRGWSVSYQISVPRRTDLKLESMNGGLHVADVTGALELSTTNGGISLRGVGGDVRGETTNGGLDVELAGDRWEGRGLDLETTNGGVTLSVPAGYSAHLRTGTVNGGFQTDLPLTVRGRIGRRIEADLGSGGAPIQVSTTNGGVRIRRK